MTIRQAFPSAFILSALIAIVAVMTLTNADQSYPRVAVIGGLAIFSFATRVLPDMVTALLSFLAFLAIDIAPPEVIFSGFSSGGIWLMISGLIIGTAITQTGLGQQVATRIFAHTGTSYVRAILILAVSGLVLGLLVPSTIPRVIVLMPVALSLATAMGFATGSRGQIGLAITAATSTLLPTYAILTANLPTIVHYGALETIYGIKPSYGLYFLTQLPTNLVRFALILAFLLPFARNTPQDDLQIDHDAVEPMSTKQKHLLALLGLAIAFWVTDSVHGISPAWIAMAAAAVIIWPSAGFLKKDAMKTGIDLTPVFFLAGIFAVSAVAHHVGLDTVIANALVPQLGLAEGSILQNLYAISGFSVIIGHLATAPAAPVVLAPLAGAIADAAHMDILPVAMAQIIGISTPILPYQAPPLLVAMALAHIPVATLTRICLGLAIGVFVLGIPLTYFWWQLIGFL